MVTWKCPKCHRDFVTDHPNPGPACAFCADPKTFAPPGDLHACALANIAALTDVLAFLQHEQVAPAESYIQTRIDETRAALQSAYRTTIDPGNGKDTPIANLVMICRRLARMADPDKRANGLSAYEIVQHAYRIADEAGVDARPSPLRDEYTEGAVNDDGSDPRPKELQF